MPKAPRPKSPWVLLATDFGYMLLAAVLLFGGGGYWLDRRRQAEVPWFTFFGTILGVAVALQSLIRRIGEMERREKARPAARDDQGSPPR